MRMRLRQGFLVLFFFFFCVHTCLAGQKPAVKPWNPGHLSQIDKSRKTFSFIFFADNQGSERIFQQLIEAVNRQEALFLIDGGDLVAIGSNKNYAFFLQQAAGFNKPLLTVVGNHDAYYGGRDFYKKFLGAFDYSFSVAESYFIILDNNRIKGLEEAQWKWLEAELIKSRQYRWRFVFMHIPLYDPRYGSYASGHSVKNPDTARRLNALFDAYGVTMVFTGHIHGYFRGTWNKTPYIISGGAGAPLVGFSPKHFFHHYIRVLVSPAGVQYEVVRY